MTLVELVAVMGAGSVLVTVAIAAFVAMLRNDRRFNDRLNAQRSVAELVERLRRDIHAAADATWDDATATLRLAAADGLRVEYAFMPSRCERREAAAEDEMRVAGVFRLPPRTKNAVSVFEKPGHTVVRVGFTSRGPTARRDAVRRETEVVAIAGRDFELLYP